MLPSLGYRLETSIFANLRNDESWSFRELTQKDTNYLTHCYHRYPSRFIPQLARRLINDNSNVGEIILDPFCGSGSSVLESLLAGRFAFGSDINPVAYLITKAKTTPIEPDILEASIEDLIKGLPYQRVKPMGDLPRGIFFWFPESAISELNILLNSIEQVDNEDIRTFLLCGFSHILKGCSYWNMHSIKPHRDVRKFASAESRPIETFRNHIAKMLDRNQQLWNNLSDLEVTALRNVEISDAKKISAPNESVSLIVTSPPYVTSYEYADIHQLTLMWLGRLFAPQQFRKVFIGSMSRREMPSQLMSNIAYDVFTSLSRKDERLGRSVGAYFSDMQQCFREMVRALGPSGRLAIVIGNTALRGVQILNAQIFVEMLVNLGLSLKKVISREVPSKYLPSTRDPATGKFVSSNSFDKVLAYPREYILILEKQG